MEVHHHPHVEKKGFKEYFLEFLMIFLAVSLGFIAENFREHIVERKHEREFMVSLLRDLGNDTADIARVYRSTSQSIARADSMIAMFRAADFGNTSGTLYFLGRQMGLRNLWRSNDGTIQQLAYAGGIRLLQYKKVIDSIQGYIRSVRELAALQALEDTEIEEYRKMMKEVFDAFTFDDLIKRDSFLRYIRPATNPELFSTDRKSINGLALEASVVKGNRIRQLEVMNRLNGKATALIGLIRREYDLEEE
jgi:hypothetical protein